MQSLDGRQEAERARSLQAPPMLRLIQEPADLRGLGPAELTELAAQIRQYLVAAVGRTGGHLGSNLGAVELTLALHRVFDSPRDTILWDTGHQAYVHKLVTGRLDEFNELRQRGGMSGYPSRSESPHDVIENSHASVALSYADGLAKARQLAAPGQTANGEIVVVVGDGALTGGVAWEALNNLGAAPERPVIVVVNDNGRSYCPTVGGLAAHLAGLREQPAPSGNVFTGLGLDYVGPVDGHDVSALEAALHDVRGRGRSAVVHCLTAKGRGYLPAETDEADRMHGPPPFEPSSGRPRAQVSATWTSVLGAELADIARHDSRVVAITAAMTGPVGLTRFTQEFPDRVFDVGIAEQHAIASAAGLALAGLHPVACVYATFINRAFDQLLMDIAMHRLPLTLVLDRAGVTGEDGASHHGMWDLATLSVIPGLRIAAPRDGGTLRRLLREAVAINGPTVLRFPKGAVGADLPALRHFGRLDILNESAAGAADVLIVAVGATAPPCLEAAAICQRLGVEVTVVDPGWVTPVPDELIDLAGRHRLVVTVEDGCREGGVGSALGDALGDRGVHVPVRRLGIPRRFLHQGSRAEILRDVGLTPEAIAAAAAAGEATRPSGSLLAFAS
jgi:1-deoxy-D-xylulose-5-phosphate synthase